MPKGWRARRPHWGATPSGGSRATSNASRYAALTFSVSRISSIPASQSYFNLCSCVKVSSTVKGSIASSSFATTFWPLRSASSYFWQLCQSVRITSVACPAASRASWSCFLSACIVLCIRVLEQIFVAFGCCGLLNLLNLICQLIRTFGKIEKEGTFGLVAANTHYLACREQS